MSFFPQFTAFLQKAAPLLSQNGYCSEVFADKNCFLGPLTLGQRHYAKVKQSNPRCNGMNS